MKLLLFSLAFVLLLTLTTQIIKHSTGTVISPYKSDFNSIGSVLKMYKINNGNYPTEEEGLKALIEKPIYYPPDKQWAQLADRIPLDPWGNPYQYIGPTSSDGEFCLYSFGRDGISLSQGNDPDDLNNWSLKKTQKSWTNRFKENNKALIAAYALLLFALVRFVHVQFIRRKSKIG